MTPLYKLLLDCYDHIETCEGPTHREGEDESWDEAHKGHQVPCAEAHHHQTQDPDEVVTGPHSLHYHCAWLCSRRLANYHHIVGTLCRNIKVMNDGVTTPHTCSNNYTATLYVGPVSDHGINVRRNTFPCRNSYIHPALSNIHPYHPHCDVDSSLVI